MCTFLPFFGSSMKVAFGSGTSRALPVSRTVAPAAKLTLAMRSRTAESGRGRALEGGTRNAAKGRKPVTPIGF